MDAPDQMLHSEGVCWQLDIMTYYSDMCTHKGKPSVTKTHDKKDPAKVLILAVNMMLTVQCTCALPSPSKFFAQVKLKPGGGSKRT